MVSASSTSRWPPPPAPPSSRSTATTSSSSCSRPTSPSRPAPRATSSTSTPSSPCCSRTSTTHCRDTRTTWEPPREGAALGVSRPRAPRDGELTQTRPAYVLLVPGQALARRDPPRPRPERCGRRCPVPRLVQGEQQRVHLLTRHVVVDERLRQPLGQRRRSVQRRQV